MLRILRVKLAMGLMDKSRSFLADRSLHRSFGSPEHRAVARQCVRQSIVILKNDGALPCPKNAAHIHVAGDSADNIGNQCGGWTVFWQGKTGEVTLGTTILQGIRDAVGPNTKVTYGIDGSGGTGAKIGIAIFGEQPYAEMMGDRADLRLDPKHLGVVARMKADGMRVIAVITSGRPMIIDDLLPYADAIVAAWLPGTEGEGIADVLFGTHKPTGKLSFFWPKATTTDYRIGSTGYHKLFDIGYGLINRGGRPSGGVGLQTRFHARQHLTTEIRTHAPPSQPSPGSTQCNSESACTHSRSPPADQNTLPARTACLPSQQLVCPTRGRSLGPMHQLRKPDMRRPKHVYVIGHDRHKYLENRALPPQAIANDL